MIAAADLAYWRELRKIAAAHSLCAMRCREGLINPRAKLPPGVHRADAAMFANIHAEEAAMLYRKAALFRYQAESFAGAFPSREASPVLASMGLPS